MSGPDNPPIGGLGEGSWAFEVKLVLVLVVTVVELVLDGVLKIVPVSAC